MKIRAILAAVALTASISGAAQAGPNPYSDCGIGSALFKNDTAATISNVIWDLGITAIVSATASPETCNGTQAETAMMILETLPDLEKQLATNTGSSIQALMTNLQCSDTAVGVVAASYEETLLSEDYVSMSEVDKATRIYKAVESVSSTSQCAVSL